METMSSLKKTGLVINAVCALRQAERNLKQEMVRVCELDMEREKQDALRDELGNHVVSLRAEMTRIGMLLAEHDLEAMAALAHAKDDSRW